METTCWELLIEDLLHTVEVSSGLSMPLWVTSAGRTHSMLGISELHCRKPNGAMFSFCGGLRGGLRGGYLLTNCWQVLPGLPSGHWVLRDLQADRHCGAAHPEVQDGFVRILLPQHMPQPTARLRPPQDPQVHKLVPPHAMMQCYLL
jgi:hypothetical protein